MIEINQLIASYPVSIVTSSWLREVTVTPHSNSTVKLLFTLWLILYGPWNLFLLFQLSLASSEVPSKVSAAVKGVEDTSLEISRLIDKFDALSSAVGNQLMNSEGIAIQLQEYVNKIDLLERTLAYLQCIKTIEDIR